MSFGVGVGDIIEVSRLAYTLYGHLTTGRRSAPQNYRKIESSLFAMKCALDNLQRHSQNTGSRNPSLNPSETDVDMQHMQTIIASCNETLQSVDEFLKKYLLVKEDDDGGKSNSGGKGKGKGVRWMVRSNFDKVKFSAVHEKQLEDLNKKVRCQTDAISLMLGGVMWKSVTSLSASSESHHKKQEEALLKLAASIQESNSNNKGSSVMDDALAGMIRDIHAALTNASLLKSPSTEKKTDCYGGSDRPATPSASEMERRVSTDSTRSPPPAYSPPPSFSRLGVSRMRARTPSASRGINAEAPNRSVPPPPPPPTIGVMSSVGISATPPPPPPPPTMMLHVASIASMPPIESAIEPAASETSTSPPPMKMSLISSPSASIPQIFEPHTDAKQAFTSSPINQKRLHVGKAQYDAWMRHHSHVWCGTEITINTPEDVVVEAVATSLSSLRSTAAQKQVGRYVHLSKILSEMWAEGKGVMNVEQREKLAADMLLSLNATVRDKQGVERELLARWLVEFGMRDVLEKFVGVVGGVMFAKQREVFEGLEREITGEEL